MRGRGCGGAVRLAWWPRVCPTCCAMAACIVGCSALGRVWWCPGRRRGLGTTRLQHAAARVFAHAANARTADAPVRALVCSADGPDGWHVRMAGNSGAAERQADELCGGALPALRPLDSALRCLICFDHLRGPVSLACGHVL